uniref:Uncharacterized protein LOC102802687 n=1 Tax=Saccoglossus kowalevskii TaxID=10224 RepID=A0ABM0LXJ9_SACKO|nr:PREDICTED: uncharacterized protein LOC102802687 [Saccoglossus kowalevskii]
MTENKESDDVRPVFLILKDVLPNKHYIYDYISHEDIFIARHPRRRFSDPVTDSTVGEIANKALPMNTQRRNMWALRAFNEWAMVRNNTSMKLNSDKHVKILQSLDVMDIKDVAHWLTKFILEARKGDGNCYPPKTLPLLVIGLQSYMGYERQQHINFLTDVEFRFSASVRFRNETIIAYRTGN